MDREKLLSRMTRREEELLSLVEKVFGKIPIVELLSRPNWFVRGFIKLGWVKELGVNTQTDWEASKGHAFRIGWPSLAAGVVIFPDDKFSEETEYKITVVFSGTEPEHLVKELLELLQQPQFGIISIRDNRSSLVNMLYEGSARLFLDHNSEEEIVRYNPPVYITEDGWIMDKFDQ